MFCISLSVRPLFLSPPLSEARRRRRDGGDGVSDTPRDDARPRHPPQPDADARETPGRPDADGPTPRESRGISAPTRRPTLRRPALHPDAKKSRRAAIGGREGGKRGEERRRRGRQRGGNEKGASGLGVGIRRLSHVVGRRVGQGAVRRRRMQNLWEARRRRVGRRPTVVEVRRRCRGAA